MVALNKEWQLMALLHIIFSKCFHMAGFGCKLSFLKFIYQTDLIARLFEKDNSDCPCFSCGGLRMDGAFICGT